ncbi:hypothetical protein LTR94_037608, partial [Friedmanniomyces endolithicus]
PGRSRRRRAPDPTGGRGGRIRDRRHPRRGSTRAARRGDGARPDLAGPRQFLARRDRRPGRRQHPPGDRRLRKGGRPAPGR